MIFSFSYLDLLDARRHFEMQCHDAADAREEARRLRVDLDGETLRVVDDEPQTIFVVVTEDRHSGTTIDAFSTLDLAISYAKRLHKQMLANWSGNLDKKERKRLGLGERKVEWAVWYAQHGVEGDSIHVEEKIVDKEGK